MARALVPKGCIIHRISLRKRGAEVGYRCGDEGGSRMYPLPRGALPEGSTEGWGTYRSKFLRSVRRVSHRGIHISGPAEIGFTLSPGHAVCRKSGPEIVCTMKGDTSSASLRGLRGRRKGRR